MPAVRFVDAEFGHATTQRARVYPENSGCTALPVDLPVEFLKYFDDMVALHILKCLDGRRQDVGLASRKIVMDLQHGAAQINDRTLDHIRQLSNISRP